MSSFTTTTTTTTTSSSSSEPSGRDGTPEAQLALGSPPHGFEGLEERWYQTSKGSNLHFYATAPGSRSPSSDGDDSPILLLAHGYPQTSYIFRHLIPHLRTRIRLFVPDQPGIAFSTAATAADKLTLGTCYLEALVAHFGRGGGGGGGGITRVVLAGHDRGARVVQRLAVSSKSHFPDVQVLGVCMMDIVPIVAQFDSFARDPAKGSRYFHWSFLPVTQIAVPMIMSFGGDRWCRALHANARGTNEEGLRLLESGGALDAYAAWYARRDVNEAAAADYKAASEEDWKAMREDQAAGRKIEVPAMVLYGTGLEKMHDMEGIWPEYVKEGTRLEMHAAGNGFGHYLPEECPEWVLGHLQNFLTSLGC